MKIYLAVLRENIDFSGLKEELEKKEIKLLDHYETVGIIKLGSQNIVFQEDFKDYFESVEEEKDNFAI